MTDGEKRAAILQAVAFLEAEGMNRGSAGNVSLRHGAGALITPTGGRGATLTPEALVEIDLDGGVIAGGIPSSEWRLHTELLRHHPEAGAVVHTHADHCVALSCLRRPIPAFHYMVAGFGGNSVPCARYEPFGSDALAAAVVEAMRDRRGCLMANHGMIVLGRSLQHALDQAVKLEMLARQYILARQAGEPLLLSDEEMAEVRRRYGFYGTAPMPR